MKLTRVLQSTIVAAVIAGALLLAPATASARVFVSVGFAPPAIPIYAQPIAPGYGYIWTPGYWAYGPDGYYWVDGAWVLPPYDGALWTPGYWGWDDDAYLWYPGYWGLSVGFYGGINYGFGYFGTGYYGGYWHGGRFFYNDAYNHIGFHNGFVYNHPVAGFERTSRWSSLRSPWRGGDSGLQSRRRDQRQEHSYSRRWQLRNSRRQLLRGQPRYRAGRLPQWCRRQRSAATIQQRGT